MAAAPSHEEREGAGPAEAADTTDPEPSGWPLTAGCEQRFRQTSAGSAGTQDTSDRRTFRIVSGPISLKALAFWGVLIFIAGFFHGRQMSELAIRASNSANSQAAAGASAGVTPGPAPSQSGSPSVTEVGIRLLKFSPETVQIKTGDTVEWANKDLTPHTVTSQGSGDLNSGSIDAGGSWRHTFTQPGNFSYYCTFHPEMKGSVSVK